MRIYHLSIKMIRVKRLPVKPQHGYINTIHTQLRVSAINSTFVHCRFLECTKEIGRHSRLGLISRLDKGTSRLDKDLRMTLERHRHHRTSDEDTVDHFSQNKQWQKSMLISQSQKTLRGKKSVLWLSP